MNEFCIIKKKHLYLHDYSEAVESVQTDPVWGFDWAGCLLFNKEYGLQVAQNVNGTLYEIENPNQRKDNSHPKIGVMLRSFE